MREGLSLAKRRTGSVDFEDWALPDDFVEEKPEHKYAAAQSGGLDDWAEYTREGQASRRKRQTKKSVPRQGGYAKTGAKKSFVGLAAVVVCVALFVGIGLWYFNSIQEPNHRSSSHAFQDISDTTIQNEADTQTLPAESEPVPESTTKPHTEFKEYRFYGSKLSEAEKRSYDLVAEALLAQKETVEGVRFSAEEGIHRVMEAIFYDYAELYWYTGEYSYVYYEEDGHLDVTLTPTYNCTPTEKLHRQNLVDSRIQALLDELSGKTEYEKVKGVYEFLIDNTAYDYAYSGQSVYDLLKNGRAVCAAYARGMQYILTKLDVEIIYVAGDAGSPGDMGSHAWNIVKIGGDYYQIDATWGDPYNEDGTQSKNFLYFCLTDEEMERDHRANREDFPACTATEYNYFVYEGRYLDSYNTELLKAWMREADLLGEPLCFKTANVQVYQEVKANLLSEGEIFTLMEEVLGEAVGYTYSYHDEHYILTFMW